MISDNYQTTHLPQNAVKCRFFGQYLEQIIAKETKYPNSPTINATTVLLIGELENYHLELKTLSKITDEDLLFICRNKKGKIEKVELIGIEENKEKKYLNIKISFSNGWHEFYTEINEIENIDYLRSKGYAVPFMEYSVEDLVSFGWVRLV